MLWDKLGNARPHTAPEDKRVARVARWAMQWVKGTRDVVNSIPDLRREKGRARDEGL